MVRIIQDLKRCNETRDTLTARLSQCEVIVNELTAEREECAALVDTCEELNNHLRKRNLVLSDRLERSEVKHKRRRWGWGIGGFILGTATGYGISKIAK
jgi:predicted dithiol-disulfide oxidoreductase (DUF899 family)